MDKSTRFSTYSIRNTLSAIDGSSAEAELTQADPLAHDFYAFKILPREFVARGASTTFLDHDDEPDSDADTGETCKAVCERIVKKISEQCQRVGLAKDDLVISKDVVRYAGSGTSI